ncbi:MAG: hypothetical protein ICV68_10475, partial [Pyrinomonadaceae bacterium]|nr:hypothetical protein [Pyrinomonadaceae bacterium]
MSSSETLAEPMEAKQKARRPMGLIALLIVFAICMAGVVAFFALSQKRPTAHRHDAQQAAAPSDNAAT